MPDISNQKKQLRKQLTVRRKQLSPTERMLHSEEIMLYLLRHLASLNPKHDPIQLLTYHALPFEVDTSLLFEQEKYQIFVPRMLPDMAMEWVKVTRQTEWHHKDFGVQEPKSGELWQSNHIKTILVTPLLGFDRSGSRLGMGKGFFDRWIEKYAHTLKTQLGLAFSCQELPKVPMEPHDAPLSTIITELGVISCPIK